MIFLMLIGALVSIVVPNMVYKGILKGVDRTLPNKKYATTFLLSATVYMIPIIIIQLSFDRILHFDSEVVDSIGRCFFISFIRASLLEEGTKFFFVRRVLKKNGALGMKETVLLAGIVGIGFGVLEKTMLGGAAMIANALFPGHMLFQWLMGYYLYKAMNAEGAERRKYYALSYLAPFVLHGVWDLGLFLSDYLMEQPGTGWLVAGLVVVVLMVALYIISIVNGIKAVKKLPA